MPQLFLVADTTWNVISIVTHLQKQQNSPLNEWIYEWMEYIASPTREKVYQVKKQITFLTFTREKLKAFISCWKPQA